MICWGAVVCRLPTETSSHRFTWDFLRSHLRMKNTNSLPTSISCNVGLLQYRTSVLYDTAILPTNKVSRWCFCCIPGFYPECKLLTSSWNYWFVADLRTRVLACAKWLWERSKSAVVLWLCWRTATQAIGFHSICKKNNQSSGIRIGMPSDFTRNSMTVSPMSNCVSKVFPNEVVLLEAHCFWVWLMKIDFSLTCFLQLLPSFPHITTTTFLNTFNDTV